MGQDALGCGVEPRVVHFLPQAALFKNRDADTQKEKVGWASVEEALRVCDLEFRV